jgi:NACHT domain
VSGKIVKMLQKIREGSPLEQADAWIRTKHYTADRLKIERLSGDPLSLERCYINLAIVEEPRKNARHAEEGSRENASPHTSPFSLTARLKVETPDKSIQVELSTLFDPRKDSNGQTIKLRRIFIRGRAGVGKTTLCKKMVDGFAHCSEDFRKWNELFDRVLWVPLRRLKEWSPTQYDLEELFSREYFAQPNREKYAALAKELRRIVERGRTLFILDGVDEIAQELTREDFKSDFLIKYLLDQPNVVVTSRPHVSLPANVRPPDLELETIGFYPGQVKAYLQAAFTDPKRVEDVQSYLQAHQLIQGLVRIPIQLDALCYTWDNFDGKVVPQTMTAIYKAIEESLWKKDVLRLGKIVSIDSIFHCSAELPRAIFLRLFDPIDALPGARGFLLRSI